MCESKDTVCLLDCLAKILIRCFLMAVILQLFWLGIILVVGGVAWVILQRPEPTSPYATTRRVRGVLLALLAAACQAAGLLFSKQGMGHGWLEPAERLSPQAATYGRMLFAGLGVLPLLALHVYRQRAGRVTYGLPPRIGSARAGLAFAACGAVVGPFLGVWMSLVASDRAPLGVAQTLCSLPPIFLLPFAATIHKERIGLRAVLGALIAVGGAALLFFR